MISGITRQKSQVGACCLFLMTMYHKITPEQAIILKHFYEQFDPHSRDDSPQLQRTRDEFNRLSQRLHPNQSFSDPLDILPPELVLQCFMALPRDRSDSLDTLLIVSRRWRYFVESASSLWTHVFVEDMERDDYRARRSIRFSRTSSITVFIALQPSLELANIFRGHTSRIQKITLRHRAYDMEFLSRDDLFLNAFISLSRLGPLSSLESLAYTTTFQSPLVIDGDRLPLMPSIKELTGFSVRSNHVGLCREFIVQISLDLALPDVHAFARECPKLEHLQLTGSPISLAFDRSLHDFPLLKHLDFDRVFGLADLLPLFYSRCTYLATLQLHLSWSQLCAADYLSHLPHLTTLKLNCVVSAVASTRHRLAMPLLRRITEFHFIQITIPSEEDNGIAMPSQWLTNMFDVFASSMRNVTFLKLSLAQEVPVDRLLDYLSHLAKLDQLELTHNKLVVEMIGKRTTLRSLKTLRLPNESLLLYVELPQIAHLWIDSMAVDAPSMPTLAQTPNNIQRTNAHPKRGPMNAFKIDLPSIQELTWNGAAAIGILRKSSNFTTAFASIRRLVFAEPYARKDANDFCEVILRQPSKCPHLETISFHCYPSWDLLFYMLFRRNIMPSAAASPIRSIELPGYPCASLLSPLIGLLSSTLIFIPPLSEIALNIRSGVFDPSRLGCDCCLDCGMPCPLEVHNVDANVEDQIPLIEEVNGPDRDEITQDWINITSNADDIIALPEPLKTWFDGWPERRKAWNARSEESGKRFRRAFSCCKHDFDNLVTFTGGR